MTMMIFYLLVALRTAPMEYYGSYSTTPYGSCIHTEYGIYYRGIPYRVLRTDCSISIVRKAKADIQSTTRQDERRICTIASWLTGLKDRIWMIAFRLDWFGSISRVLRYPSNPGRGWMDEEWGERKVKKSEKKRRKRKYSPEFQKEVETFMVRQNVGSLRRQASVCC